MGWGGGEGYSGDNGDWGEKGFSEKYSFIFDTRVVLGQKTNPQG